MRYLPTSLLLILLIAGIARAQEPVLLTLDRAIDVSLENNSTIRSAQLEVDKAEAQISEAYGNALPSVDLSANYSRNLEKQVFYFPNASGEVQPISIGSDNAVTTELRIQQILFNGAVFKGVGIAKTYGELSRQQLRAEASTTVASVRKAYYAAQVADATVKINEVMMENARRNYENAQAMYEQGVRAEFDAVRAQVQMANIKPQIIQAQNSYNQARDNLAFLLGMESGRNLEIADTLALPADTIPSLDELLRVIRANNPQLQAARLGSEVREQAIGANAADYLPTLALFGSYQYQAQADAFGDLDFQPSAVAGLSLSMNLFKGGQTKAIVEQARIDHQIAQENYTQAQRATAMQLEAALRNMSYAREQYQASLEVLMQAQRAVEIASVSYQAGTGTMLEINDAEVARVQAQYNRLNAIYAYNVARADLEQLLSTDLTLDEDSEEVRYQKK